MRYNRVIQGQNSRKTTLIYTRYEEPKASIKSKVRFMIYKKSTTFIPPYEIRRIHPRKCYKDENFRGINELVAITKEQSLIK